MSANMKDHSTKASRLSLNRQHCEYIIKQYQEERTAQMFGKYTSWSSASD